MSGGRLRPQPLAWGRSRHRLSVHAMPGADRLDQRARALLLTSDNFPGQGQLRLSPVTPTTHITHTARTCRSGPLFDGLKNHHALHVMRHRFHVTGAYHRKTAGQRRFTGSASALLPGPSVKRASRVSRCQLLPFALRAAAAGGTLPTASLTARSPVEASVGALDLAITLEYAHHRTRALDGLSPVLTTLAARTRRPPTDTPASGLFTHLGMPLVSPHGPLADAPRHAIGIPRGRRGHEPRERSQGKVRPPDGNHDNPAECGRRDTGEGQLQPQPQEGDRVRRRRASSRARAARAPAAPEARNSMGPSIP